MTATDTYLLLRALCDELASCGVRHAATSPGSRNTPIVLSLHREPRIRLHSHIDERCAGFFALGAAKASGQPVAVTCTSGTAAANLAPAVIEAHEARVPLIVLTADRPPELREIGAGQTIDQLKLYGSAVKWFFEVGVQECSSERLRWIRALARRAYWTARDGRPGPVHLNLPLREPLVLDAPLPALDTPPAARRLAARAGTPTGTRDLPARGVVVAGRSERDPSFANVVAAFAAAAGYPLLADPLSGARRGIAAIATYDLLLRSRALSASLEPELVIRVGDLPTSKPLRAWLASLSAEQIAFDPEASWQDPASVTTTTIDADPVPWLRWLTPRAAVDPAWLDRWIAADDTAADAITAALGEALSEPVVAARLGEWLPRDATLFVAASMPVRDIEEFWPARLDPPRVLANRGANGIDGTVSSAFGVAAVSEHPVVLLIGDVALAHDIGGLLAARRLGLSLTIVLINNDGGGIFHFLPVAEESDAFESQIATPHGLDFAHAAALYGCTYRAVDSVPDFRAALDASLTTAGTSIVEIRTDRVENRALHARVADAVTAALSR